MSRVVVGGHVFDVPEEYLVASDVPSRSAPQSGLTAVLNPKAPSKDQILLGVDAADEICNFPTPPVIDQLPRACAVAQGKATQQNPGRLTKVLRFPNDPTQYDYRGEDGGVAVSCSARRDGNGSCDASFAWHDLIWTASFDESHVMRLEEIRADVVRHLDQWSVKAS